MSSVPRGLRKGSSKRVSKKVVEERVRTLADLMIVGKYVTGDTPRKYAEQWGCTWKTVQNYASTAALIVRMEVGDDPLVRAKLLGTFDRTATVTFTLAEQLAGRLQLEHTAAIAVLKANAKAQAEAIRLGVEPGEMLPIPEVSVEARDVAILYETGMRALDRLRGLTGIGKPEPEGEIGLPEVMGAAIAAGKANERPIDVAEVAEISEEDDT